MLVLLFETYAALTQHAARVVINAIRKKPDLVLGLATGNTPLGLYSEVVRIYHERNLDFSRLKTFNLDEYLGLPPDHPQSYHAYMQENFFRHVSVPKENIHIPDGTIRESFQEYCDSYEAAIKKSGGIDLQILGIGKTGHIGFNEPTSSLASRTRLKTLTEQTRRDNQQIFGSKESVPECAITMGIGTILTAKKILLLAAGASKAAAVASAIEGPITSSVSASALQLHPDVTILLDPQAAANFDLR